MVASQECPQTADASYEHDRPANAALWHSCTCSDTLACREAYACVTTDNVEVSDDLEPSWLSSS